MSIQQILESYIYINTCKSYISSLQAFQFTTYIYCPNPDTTDTSNCLKCLLDIHRPFKLPIPDGGARKAKLKEDFIAEQLRLCTRRTGIISSVVGIPIHLLTKRIVQSIQK